MLTAEQLRTLQPPDGWELERRPTLRTSGTVLCPAMTRDCSSVLVSEHLQRLHAWAKQNDLGIGDTPDLGKTGSAIRWIDQPTGVSGYAYRRYRIFANAPERTKVRIKKYEKSCCGGQAEAHDLVCEVCYLAISCGQCGYSGFTQHKIEVQTGARLFYCSNCSTPCETEGCAKRIRKSGTTTKKCQDCEPQAYCQWCDKTVAQANARPISPEQRNSNGRIVRHAAWICNPCYDKRKCPKCEIWNEHVQLVTRGHEKMCRMCADQIDAKDLETHMAFTNDEIPISGNIVIPSTRQRPFRTVSVETEMNGDGGFIARQLYRCGFVDRPAVAGYHEHSRREDQHVSFLKHDGSVTGGELITYLVNLDEADHADAFMQVLSTLRAIEKVGKAEFTHVCGGHIHIDSHNLDFSDAWRYVTVYNFLENVIYRLGGAGTGPLQVHRTLVPGHDRPNGGRGYSNSIIKGPFGTQSTFGRSLMDMGRTVGLNFQHFIKARANCGCGAYAVENSKACSCNLGKSTIEWRVWNSTANPRILHAWIALMQAVTAYADSDKKMSEKEENEFPAFAWDRKLFAPSHHATTKERLEWMHTQLPLSRAERDSLIYAAKHSELRELGDEYLEHLLQLENKSTVPEKKVRNPNRRERNIIIEPPAPDAMVGGANPF